MQIHLFVLFVSAVLLLCNGTAMASEHPAETCTPGNVPEDFYPAGTLHADDSLGQLTFSPPLEVERLSSLERYILVGGRAASGQVLEPWWREWMYTLHNVYAQLGRIPAQCDESTLKNAWHAEDGYDCSAKLSLLKNPYTGSYPMLDGSSTAPGNMFVAILSEEELRHFAKPARDAMLADAIDGSLEMGGRTFTARISRPVFYIRVYGESGVILEKLAYVVFSD